MRSDAKYKTKNNHKHKNNPIPKAEDGAAVENPQKRGFWWKNLWKTECVVTVLTQIPCCTCLRTRPELLSRNIP